MLSGTQWTLALEQILIFVLVFGKWIGPKGHLTTDELSQLLLVTIAGGADILELLETFSQDNVSSFKKLVPRCVIVQYLYLIRLYLFSAK